MNKKDLNRHRFYCCNISENATIDTNSDIYVQQDACTGVHSACRREENGHNLDICVLRRLRPMQAWADAGISWS